MKPELYIDIYFDFFVLESLFCGGPCGIRIEFMFHIIFTPIPRGIICFYILLADSVGRYEWVLVNRCRYVVVRCWENIFIHYYMTNAYNVREKINLWISELSVKKIDILCSILISDIVPSFLKFVPTLFLGDMKPSEITWITMLKMQDQLRRHW